MDELTAERYGWLIPTREASTWPPTLARVWWPEADWETVAERQRILAEALGPKNRRVA